MKKSKALPLLLPLLFLASLPANAQSTGTVINGVCFPLVIGVGLQSSVSHTPIIPLMQDAHPVGRTFSVIRNILRAGTVFCVARAEFFSLSAGAANLNSAPGSLTPEGRAALISQARLSPAQIEDLEADLLAGVPFETAIANLLGQEVTNPAAVNTTGRSPAFVGQVTEMPTAQIAGAGPLGSASAE